MQKQLPLNFILSFCREKINGHGEDNYCYSFCDFAGILGAFDGCGGAGARQHDCYSGHTEADIAARICSGAFYDWFRELFPGNHSPEQLANEVFLRESVQRLITYQPIQNDGFVMKGSMVRTLPTTAAVALIQQCHDSDEIQISAIWAGDSRVYIMDSNGLAQLTVDDTGVPDPMMNLYDDGVLKNIFCSDKPVKLHCNTVRVRPPFVAFSATDGCFGYVSTPMEFEGILLNSLIASSSAAEWETALAEQINAVSGDDHTITMAAFGYNGFEDLKNAFQTRYRHLYERYLLPVSQMNIEDRQSRFALWQQYKPDYLRFLKDGRNGQTWSI